MDLMWRPLNGRSGLRVAVWPQGPKSRVCGAWPTAYRLHARLSVKYSAAAAAVGARGAI